MLLMFVSPVLCLPLPSLFSGFLVLEICIRRSIHVPIDAFSFLLVLDFVFAVFLRSVLFCYLFLVYWFLFLLGGFFFCCCYYCCCSCFWFVWGGFWSTRYLLLDLTPIPSSQQLLFPSAFVEEVVLNRYQGQLLSLSLTLRVHCVCLFVGCLTSQQQASVSQGRICSDNLTCCHTEIEVADPTFYLTQSQFTDTGPTSPSADPITPGAWQGSHLSANFEITGMTRPRKNPGASGIRTRDLPLSRRTPYH